MEYRRATVADIPEMCRIRKQQLIDEGISPDGDIDAELVRFFEDAYRSDTLVEWLLEDEGRVIATSAVLFMAFPPSYTNFSGMKGYVTNMYTHPDYRGQGIATTMLGKLAEEARTRHVSRLFLGASKLGRSVYEHFGFREVHDMLEMRLD